MKRFLKLISAAPAIFALALIFSTCFGFVGGLLIAGASMLIPGMHGVALSGLNAEAWTDELMEQFYADDSWLSECQDLSMFVDNDKINFAEAGINPEVLINNTTYPIPVTSRTDTPLSIELDTFDTTNTEVKDIEKAELVYDKLKSIVDGHKNELRMTIMERGAHAVAPASNTTATPILTASGTADEDGFAKLTFKDVIRLKRRFDAAKYPAVGRVLVLGTHHEAHLEEENITLYNQIATKGTLYGFKVYILAEDSLPRYNKTTGAKVAWGAAAAPSTDTRASFAFHKTEVARALGTAKMYHSKSEDDPLNRKDIVGFQQRAIVVPKRFKGIAAVYSPAA